MASDLDNLTATIRAAAAESNPEDLGWFSGWLAKHGRPDYSAKPRPRARLWWVEEDCDVWEDDGWDRGAKARWVGRFSGEDARLVVELRNAHEMSRLAALLGSAG